MWRVFRGNGFSGSMEVNLPRSLFVTSLVIGEPSLPDCLPHVTGCPDGARLDYDLQNQRFDDPFDKFNTRPGGKESGIL